MEAVKKERPDVAVGFYTNNEGWKKLAKLGNIKGWLKEFLFWYAWYPFDHKLRYPSPPDGVNIEDVYLWQYWADGNNQGRRVGVESRAVDINISRDPRSEFLAEAKNVTVSSELDETVVDPPVQVQNNDIWNSALNKAIEVSLSAIEELKLS